MILTKKSGLRRALLKNLINGIEEVLKQHRCSLSRDEVSFLEQSITLLKEYRKSGKDTDTSFKIITIQVVEILMRFFLFGSESDNLEDLL